jgi:hypothetical protein
VRKDLHRGQLSGVEGANSIAASFKTENGRRDEFEEVALQRAISESQEEPSIFQLADTTSHEDFCDDAHEHCGTPQKKQCLHLLPCL